MKSPPQGGLFICAVESRDTHRFPPFDPKVSHFGTLDPRTTVPPDQLDEVAPTASQLP